MAINQRKAGIVISYAGQFVQILSGLIYTPIMLRILGQSEYGLYQLVNSVVSYLSLLSLGFGSSYMRFYSREKANNNQNEIDRLNGMFFLIFLALSILCIICGVGLIINIKSVFAEGLTEAEYSTARILMAFMVLNLALSFPNTVFNCIITSQERFLFQKTVIFLQYLLNPFLTLPLLLLGYGSIGMVIVATVIAVGGFLLNIFYCFHKLKVHFCFTGLRFSLLKEMWIFTFFIFLNQIVDQINWSVDKFLLGRMLGTTAVAIYGVGGQINVMYLQLSSSVSNVFIPKVNTIVAEQREDEELTQVFTKVGRIQFMIMFLVLSGFTIFGKAFIKLWAGSEYEQSYYISLLLLFPVTVPLIQNLGIEIQRAKNKHKARSLVYFAVAIANVFISIPLIRAAGPIGASIGTAISLTVGNIIFMNWYYHYKLGLNIIYFWKRIASLLPSLFIPIILGYIMGNCIACSSWFILVIEIVIYSTVYCISLFCIGMTKSEKNEIVCPIIQKLREK